MRPNTQFLLLKAPSNIPSVNEKDSFNQNQGYALLI